MENKLDFETAIEVLRCAIFENYSEYKGAVEFVSTAFNVPTARVLELSTK